MGGKWDECRWLDKPVLTGIGSRDEKSKFWEGYKPGRPSAWLIHSLRGWRKGADERQQRITGNTPKIWGRGERRWSSPDWSQSAEQSRDISPDKEKVQGLTWLADIGCSSLIYLLEMTGFMSPDANKLKLRKSVWWSKMNRVCFSVWQCGNVHTRDRPMSWLIIGWYSVICDCLDSVTIQNRLRTNTQHRHTILNYVKIENKIKRKRGKTQLF